MKNRLLALALAAATLFALASCAKPQPADVSTEKKTIKMVTWSHPTWPYDENWKCWEYMKEGAGVDLEIAAYPTTDYFTKLSLIFASPSDMPDVCVFNYKPDSDAYADQGALIAFDDKEEFMPNFTAFKNSLGDEERDELLRQCRAADGHVYYPPSYGVVKATSIRSWLYRRDIFEKNNLTAPETMDDLYAVCSKLKSIYPDSYPFSVREGLDMVSVIGPSWRPYFNWDMYYDFNDGTWHYGASEDTMLEIVTFLKKMYDEKLVNPDFFTIKTKSWEELITSNKGFIMPEQQVRIDTYMSMADDIAPGFDFTACVPPYVKNGTGAPRVNRANLSPNGIAVCNTGNDSQIEASFRFVDWMYSDEACELLSWGKEGETYEMKDGKRQYILGDSKNNAKGLYGFWSYGSFLRFDDSAVDAFMTKWRLEIVDMAAEHTEKDLNPKRWLAYNDEEKEVKTTTGVEIDNYSKEMLMKFIIGSEPLSKWDEFQAGLKEMGVDKLINAYTSAYDRVK